jgi:hypothetical protein
MQVPGARHYRPVSLVKPIFVGKLGVDRDAPKAVALRRSPAILFTGTASGKPENAKLAGTRDRWAERRALYEYRFQIEHSAWKESLCRGHGGKFCERATVKRRFSAHHQTSLSGICWLTKVSPECPAPEERGLEDGAQARLDAQISHDISV